MKKQINDLLLKMQTGENCIQEKYKIKAKDEQKIVRTLNIN